MSKTATLTLNGKSYVLPVRIGTEDEVSIDISNLRDETGKIPHVYFGWSEGESADLSREIYSVWRRGQPQ